MLQLKEAYENDAILKLFPKPDYSHISSDIIVHDPIWIPFNQIWIDDEEGNAARSDGQNPSHIEDLRLSFANGVLTNQPVGAVEVRSLDENGNKYPKSHKLKYGFGRSFAQMELGVKGWAFNSIIATPTQWEDIQSFENEDPAPKASNKEKDIINVKSKQVKNGTLANNEDVILANLKKIYPTRKKESINRIAAAIYETVGTPIKYAYYTEAKIRLWKENHSSGNFEIGGDWDIEEQKFGYTTKIGGLYRTFHRSLVKYADCGFVSYVNTFTGQVSKGSTLEQQRVAIVNEYIKLRVDRAVTYGNDVKYLTLNGFFPQAYGVDNWKEFIKLDQEELEKKIKLAIKTAKANKKLQSAS